MGWNPQYALTLANRSSSTAPVWLLLTRHITQRQEVLSDYLTLHVFRGGERQYYSEKAMLLGTYINSVHFLVRFDAPVGNSRFTVVVSQYERNAAIAYTLDAYSTQPFTLVKLAVQWPIERRYAGIWTAQNAGGAVNDTRFGANPQWRLVLFGPSRVLVKLELPEEYSGNVILVRGEERVSVVYVTAQAFSTGDYRRGFAYAASDEPLAAGSYVVVASTFKAGETGAFTLTVACDTSDFTLDPLA